MNLSIAGVIIGCVLGGVVVLIQVKRYARQSREWGRFENLPQTWVSAIAADLRCSLMLRAARRRARLVHSRPAAITDVSELFSDAGFDLPELQERFYFGHDISTLTGIFLALPMLAFLETAVACVIIVVGIACGYFGPWLWLRWQIARRRRGIQSEHPFVLYLLFGLVSSGTDPLRALEAVTDTVALEFPHHPLVRELRRAQWEVMVGSRWSDAVSRVGARLGDDEVKRSMLGMARALGAEVPQIALLEALANEAHRALLRGVNARTTRLPVQLLLVVIVLLMSAALMGAVPVGS